MTEREFVFWLKGYLKAIPDSQTKKEVLEMIDKIDAKPITFHGTTSDVYNGTIKWHATNSDVWFNNKYGKDGSADHLS